MVMKLWAEFCSSGEHFTQWSVHCLFEKGVEWMWECGSFGIVGVVGNGFDDVVAADSVLQS